MHASPAQTILGLFISPDTYDFWADQLGSIDAWSRCYARVVGFDNLGAEGFILTVRPNRHGRKLIGEGRCAVTISQAGRKQTQICACEVSDDGKRVQITVPGSSSALSDWLLNRASEGSSLELGLATEAPSQRPASSEQLPAEAATALVTLRRSGTKLRVSRELSLLEALEAEGVQPTYGCRRGICNRCACTRFSGSTIDTNSGERDDSQHSPVRICVNRADSDLELDL